MARKVRRLPLPKGMTFLLEIAAGDIEALREAAALTAHPHAVLQEATGFFIEQILFSRNADNYRTLGASSQASYSELRHHMALLMRWLHPDLVSGGACRPCLDRSVYASRVTKAWEAVKSGERRAADSGRLTHRTGGQNTSKQPVIAVLLRIDELQPQEEAGQDGEAFGAGSS